MTCKQQLLYSQANRGANEYFTQTVKPKRPFPERRINIFSKKTPLFNADLALLENTAEKTPTQQNSNQKQEKGSETTGTFDFSAVTSDIQPIMASRAQVHQENFQTIEVPTFDCGTTEINMLFGRAKNSEIQKVQKTPKNRKAKEPAKVEIQSPASQNKVEASM